ncbi:oxysterol-binding protein related protein OSH3 [Apiospora saccharicola]|uniref:Oxysterol-binding protein related protein OSH3 n=1 Tax=Apiospora saccharicola TaxID=335842 RepID=A0ABR1WED1_9PEZI
MAGIEQLEIHSKSYIVRWVKVDEGHTISWSVQPHKKSVNFGIIKHPGSGATTVATSAASVDELNKTFENIEGSTAKSNRFRRDASSAQEQLQSKGFTVMKWHGKCEADKVSMGTYDVTAGESATFGLVFDNTFSKQTSKTATFVLLTYPTGQSPQGAAYLPNLQAAAASKTSLVKPSPQTAAAASDSVDSLQSHRTRALSLAAPSEGGTSSTYHTGNLLKRRRKKGQGFARRFFSLDYSSCTLSYYYNRNSSALRGAIPLSLAAIAADERRREINIDSGAEVWHLRASNAKDFDDWAKALERASRIARGLEPEPSPDHLNVPHSKQKPVVNTAPGGPSNHVEEDREWQQVESLVSRVVGSRDALRRLVKDMASQKQYNTRPTTSSTAAAPAPSSPSVVEEAEGYFPQQSQQGQDKRPFWKRKSSTSVMSSPNNFQPAVSSALASPSTDPAATPVPNGPAHSRTKSKGMEQEERSTQEHCAALLNDLDSVVTEFTALIANSKRRRIPAPMSANTSRRSMESTASTEEFFDAEAGEMDERNQVVMIDRQSEGDDSQGSDAEDASIHSSSSVSSVGEEDKPLDATGAAALFPVKPKSLIPLPIDIGVERRRTVPAATVPPPSLIAFVRKNVGKDLSTISMPVSSNEPISLVQRVAEQLEYAQLLDKAAKSSSADERLVYMAAFAVSQFSGYRGKERAIRKPFNPLLGETFEMLRTDSEVPGGFRLVVEKVSHRPVRLAMQADAALWSFTQSPAPTQKFWGKSAEVTTEGRVRVALRLPDGTDELYSWTIATMFLRNVVMGEKYIEPVGTMDINNESTGAKAVAEFRAKGMFGGRGEDIHIEFQDANGKNTGKPVTGTWTGSLKNGSQEIWKVGELVPNAANTYGLTSFAATLNEITDIERDRLPLTDSRLRPDQRRAEEGKLDDAEEKKVLLEEAQRVRRRDLEARGETWSPKWFVKASDPEAEEEVWRLKSGKDGYWESRERKFEGAGVEDIFASGV